MTTEYYYFLKFLFTAYLKLPQSDSHQKRTMQQTFYRPDVTLVAEATASKHWTKEWCKAEWWRWLQHDVVVVVVDNDTWNHKHRFTCTESTQTYSSYFSLSAKQKRSGATQRAISCSSNCPAAGVWQPSCLKISGKPDLFTSQYDAAILNCHR